MRRTSRPWVLALGVLLLQVIWILAVPPFRAIDEFDHAYRASAVAHGEWLGGEPAVEGRGDYVTVPASLVRAARPVCEWYPYTLKENCAPARVLDDGQVVVASASARYHPVFYWLVGTPSSVMQGSAFLYGTRIMAALLNVVMLLLALMLLRRTGFSSWLGPGVLVCLTPSFVFMTTVGAPNGTEACAAVLLFAGLLVPGLDAEPRLERLALACVAVSAVVLATLRTLGPLWLIMLVLASVTVVGWSSWRAFVMRHHVAVAFVSIGVVAAVLGALAWSASQEVNALDQEREGKTFDHAWSASIARIPLWFLQSIAAAPTRDEPAPAVVYAIGLVLVVGWFTLTLRGAGRRWWALLGGLAVAWVAVQYAFSVAGYGTLGAWWQGRYALPFLICLPMTAAYLAVRRGVRGPGRLAWAVGALFLAAMNAVHAASIALNEPRRGYLTDDVMWLRPPIWLIALLAVMAAACLMWDAVRAARPLGSREQARAAGAAAEARP